MSFTVDSRPARDMLEKYRKTSEAHVVKEAANFLAMTPKEQLELMYYQGAHLASAMHQIQHMLHELMLAHNELCAIFAEDEDSGETPH